MNDPSATVELWIEDLPLQRLSVTGQSPRLLHHYRDCCEPPATIGVMGVVRDSECSGTYAVESGPPWVVLGDVCAMCRRRYLHENGGQS